MAGWVRMSGFSASSCCSCRATCAPWAAAGPARTPDAPRSGVFRAGRGCAWRARRRSRWARLSWRGHSGLEVYPQSLARDAGVKTGLHRFQILLALLQRLPDALAVPLFALLPVAALLFLEEAQGGFLRVALVQADRVFLAGVLGGHHGRNVRLGLGRVLLAGDSNLMGQDRRQHDCSL